MSLPTRGPEEAGGAWGLQADPGPHSGGQAAGPARPAALGPVSPCPGFLERNFHGPLGVRALPARVAGGCNSGRLLEFTRISGWARRGPPCLQATSWSLTDRPVMCPRPFWVAAEEVCAAQAAFRPVPPQLRYPHVSLEWSAGTSRSGVPGRWVRPCSQPRAWPLQLSTDHQLTELFHREDRARPLLKGQDRDHPPRGGGHVPLEAGSCVQSEGAHAV